jgi:transposase
MAFAQLTYRESLRDIETCLRALRPKLYHAGMRNKISRSTLAEANENRDWRIYSDFAQGLIQRARQLYAHEDFGVTLDHAAYAFDSTTIDLCLSLFPWAQFRRHKAAIKIHTLMDLHGSIPCFIRITSGKIHDVRILDELALEPGSFYIMDRAYIDFRRLYTFTQQSAFFITRAKSDLDYIRRSYRHVDKATGVKSDQMIALVGPRTSLEYPDCLRRISYFDSENKKDLVFLTNNFMLPPLTIAQLYRCRWQVELFFKWIKQHLRIKAFYGTSENAIKTQIWIAINIYVLVAILKKELNLERNLNEILQILSITIFENRPIYQVLSDFCLSSENQLSEKQLFLFDS